MTCLPWIANNPGVVHGDHDTAGARTGQDDFSLRERIIPPALVTPGADNKTVQEVAAQNHSAPPDHYDCDWFEIHQALTTIIDALGLQEPAPRKKSGLLESMRTMLKTENR